MRRHRTAGRLLGLISGTVLTAATALIAPATAAGATLDVCADGCAFTEIGPALVAAGNGDTIRVAAGTYAGGIVIDTSITLLGAGAGRTIIKGGGPAVTIGTFGARKQPTVVLDGLTITGGVTHSSPVSNAWVDQDNVIALGGGVEILPDAAWKGGATVTIRDSVITGNKVAPTDTVPFGPPCPGGHCPFSLAEGGGIDNWGDLSLVRTTVSHNTAAGVASDADGGGISTWGTGSLTLDHSHVIANRAIAAVPNGRFAEGGGIYAGDDVKVTITDSVVSHNVASLTSTMPFDVGGGDTLDMNANGGGIHRGNGGKLTIVRSVFRANSVTVDDPNGQPYAFDSAISPGDGPLSVSDSLLTDNHVSAVVGSSADAGPSGSAIDVCGPATISGTRITGNTTLVVSESGDAQGSGVVFGCNTTNRSAVISDSIISGNALTAKSTSGSASALGAGVLNEAGLTLNNVKVSDNIGVVHAPTGFAQGAGIWNGHLLDDAPIKLVVRDSSVTGNHLQGDAGVTVEGGGLFTDLPITLRRTTIADNQPDDCVGC